MNEQLRFFRKFYRIYIDNIIVFFKSFAKHLKHLRILFLKFVAFEVILSFNKIYLNYSSITLLEQKVDAFNLSKIEKRIEIIKTIRFLRNLKMLEAYLNFANY